jgi:hypothetical protein
MQATQYSSWKKNGKIQLVWFMLIDSIYDTLVHYYSIINFIYTIWDILKHIYVIEY